MKILNTVIPQLVAVPEQAGLNLTMSQLSREADPCFKTI